MAVKGVPLHPPDVLERLSDRKPKSVDETLKLIQDFENMYGKFGCETLHKEDRQHGAYYLTGVSAEGVRTYERHTKPHALRVDRTADSNVTWIEFLQETIDENVIRELLGAVEVGRIHVFTSTCENFCVGASAGGDAINPDGFLQLITRFAELHTRLASLDLPIIVLCHGATRGGGMLFPAIADIVGCHFRLPGDSPRCAAWCGVGGLSAPVDGPPVPAVDDDGRHV